ncbi:hypothetical protein [Nocardioides sp. REDSEA-S30_B4]|uniref:VG15 protein n=1 Tax=Nocardioides sp. REDSEA-S30_B4 TaxID=1811552 RepID=UPI000AD26DF7|nr:hypothetical protein [Nocardioides sp. REDSEA-S30_B4]
MATQAEAIAHREALADVITLAIAELVTEWPSLPLDSPEAARVALAGLLGDLLDAFHPVAGGLGADWYDDLRLAANVPGSFTAPLPDLPPVQQIEKTASWAASGLYVDVDKALADSAAAVERLLALADREAIETAADRDPQPARWARYASPNACAFCALNATRGPVFRSEDTAASKYHNHCRCIAVPVWSMSDYDEAPFVADWRETYYAARDAAGPGADAKAILAQMRRLGGLR